MSRLGDAIEKAVRLTIEQFTVRHGADAILEDGEEIAAVFNDAVITVSLKGKELHYKVLIDEPYHIDFSLCEYRRSDGDNAQIVAPKDDFTGSAKGDFGN